MFLSVKWKAVIFLSLVFLLITGAWVSHHVYNTLKTYDNRIAENHVKQQQLLMQLLDDNFLRLSQLSQLIAEIPAIQRANFKEAPSALAAALQQEWSQLNINTGLDFIGVYGTDGTHVASGYNHELFRNTEALEEAISVAMRTNRESTPDSFLFCYTGCSQFVVEPFVLNNGEEALIVTAQNMADIILRFHQISGQDLAVLLPPITESSGAQTRILDNWWLRIWAASNFELSLAQLRQIEKHTPFSEIATEEVEHNGSRLLFDKLNLADYWAYGERPVLLTVSNHTEQHQMLINALTSSVAIGLFVLVISEMVLLFIMLTPLRRLTAVVQALTLLPKHQYREALTKVAKRQVYFRDEVTQLESSTRYVIRELETLHLEVEEKSLSLEGQVAMLSRSRAFLERLIDSSHLFIVTMTPSSEIRTSNGRFDKEFKRPLSNFSRLFTSNAAAEDYHRKLDHLRKGDCEVVQFDAEFVNDQGVTIYFDWTCSIVEDEKGRDTILAIGIDLTQRKRDEEALEWMANNDPLTGIGNRRCFQHDLHNLLDTQKSGAVIFIDVNRFKQINDLYGHSVGDTVLIQIANTLGASVRSSDSISRLAGDEFTVILPNIDASRLSQFLEKLSHNLAGHVILEDENRSVEYNVSIGAALLHEHGTNEQDLIVHADMAMYQAKKKGNGHWQIFDPDNNDLANLRRDHDLTSLLKLALKRNDLFQLNFQPIYAIDEAAVSHYEVLLRLTDTERQAVYPSDFIPAAERMGLIRLVDEWVLDNALEKLATDHRNGASYTFSINISAPTLQSADFPAVLAGLMKKHEVAPRFIVVELTETAYIENFQMVLSNLQKISEAGVLVALDDFGVGFSSFSYLKKLPLSYVKLDGSYIIDLEKNPDNQVFVESLTNMVNAFGMKTIAEFVEDASTLKKLHELGVAYAQGYYIGKPLPVLDDMITKENINRINTQQAHR
ncbi:EAL domain-containing protein [Marinobacter litoralis]|uniref:bifunctional diguanylate cyclase/phosphodiesterase n=1 Tax=Marinobacter litoralis TaxID=187981 RepID=UPI0018EC6ABB|nr:EAL domain-containing protein [Marinobacter litoralis]MBJ6138985.1 EAL domain-containing protein [Marinobacter litoralis]